MVFLVWFLVLGVLEWMTRERVLRDVPRGGLPSLIWDTVLGPVVGNRFGSPALRPRRPAEAAFLATVALWRLSAGWLA